MHAYNTKSFSKKGNKYPIGGISHITSTETPILGIDLAGVIDTKQTSFANTAARRITTLLRGHALSSLLYIINILLIYVPVTEKPPGQFGKRYATPVALLRFNRIVKYGTDRFDEALIHLL